MHFFVFDSLFRVRQAANRVVLVCSTNLRIFSVTLRPPGPFRNDEQRKVVEMEGADSKPVKGRGRQCCICDKRRAALKRPKTLEQICRECFYEVFEEEQVIVQNQLFKPGERIAIGASGGKDSTVLAYVLSELNRRHNYGLYLFLLSVDEGITGYRDEGISSQKWCKACVLLEGLNRGLPKLGIGRSRGLNNDYTKGAEESNGTKSFESKQCGTLDF